MWQAINPAPLIVDKKVTLEIRPEALPAGWQVQDDRIIVSAATDTHKGDAAATSSLLTTLKDAVAGCLLGQVVDTARLHPRWQLALIGFRRWLRTVPDIEPSNVADGAQACQSSKTAQMLPQFPVYLFSDFDWA